MAALKVNGQNRNLSISHNDVHNKVINSSKLDNNVTITNSQAFISIGIIWGEGVLVKMQISRPHHWDSDSIELKWDLYFENIQMSLTWSLECLVIQK